MAYRVTKCGVDYTFVDTGKPEGWLESNFSNWETDTFKVFEHFKNKSKVAIDIGAWIGLTSIWLSKNFSKVICVEGDKYSVEDLKSNLEASNCTNVEVIAKPIFSVNTSINFGLNSYLSNQEFNGSTSQIKLNPNNSQDYLTDTCTLMDVIQYLSPEDIGLVKVDIEGGEENILKDLFSLVYSGVPVYLSFHIDWWGTKSLDSQRLWASKLVYRTTNFDIVNPVDYLNSNPGGSLLINRK